MTTLGYRHSEATKARIRAKVSASLTGKVLTDEHRAAIAAGARRVMQDPAHRDKFGKAHGPDCGHCLASGRPSRQKVKVLLTHEERSARMTEAQAHRRGIRLPLELRLKISEAMKSALLKKHGPPLPRGPRGEDMRRAQLLLPLSLLRTLECVYCGSPARTRDHVIPYAQGGRATEDNIVPACRPCNSSKSRRTPAEWLEAGLRGC